MRTPHGFHSINVKRHLWLDLTSSPKLPVLTSSERDVPLGFAASMSGLNLALDGKGVRHETLCQLACYGYGDFCDTVGK